MLVAGRHSLLVVAQLQALSVANDVWSALKEKVSNATHTASLASAAPVFGSVFCGNRRVFIGMFIGWLCGFMDWVEGKR